MPECDYCGDSFDGESAYQSHLKREHEDELSRVDKRRVEGTESEESISIGAIVIGLMVVGGFLVAGYVAVIGGGFGEDGPHGDIHEHGTFEVIIDGEPVDFDQSQYIEQDPHFHFHGGDRVDQSTQYVFHVHSMGVTIEYALESLGFEIASDGSELTVGDETYRDEDPDTSISVTVDGESVEPGDHELGGGSVSEARNGEGDDVSIIVSTDE